MNFNKLLNFRNIKTISNNNINKRFQRLSNLNKMKIDENVIVNGWVKSIRRQKKMTFITINDGSLINGFQV